MGTKEIKGRFIQKHDIEANWKLATNFSPLFGEIIIYDADENYAYDRIKVGDGKTNVNDLPFMSLNVNQLQQKEEDMLILGGGLATEIGTPPTANEEVAIIPASSQDSILTIKDKMYIVKYEAIPYFDENGNKKENSNPIYITKIGDGVHNLIDISPVQNLVSGNEGEGSIIQFLESELYEIADSGVNTTRSTAIGKGSFAGGRYNKVVGRESAAFNYNNEVLGEKCFATGQANKINKTVPNSTKKIESAFVAGHANEVVAPYQVVIGSYSNADVNDAFVIGNGSAEIGRQNAFKVTRYGDIQGKTLETTSNINSNGNITGQNLIAKDGINAVNINVSNNLGVTNNLNCKTLTVSNSTTLGTGSVAAKHTGYGGSTASGLGSAAFGGNNKVYGETSFAILTSNIVPENLTHVFIAGHANTATASHQTILGTYADPQPKDKFVVGNGTSKGRKNVLAVDINGNMRIGGTQIVLGATVLNEQELKDIKSITACTEQDSEQFLTVALNAFSYVQ